MIDQNFRYTQVFSNTGHALSHLFMMIYPTVVLALETEFSAPYHVLISLMLAGNILFGAAALPAGYLGDKWGAYQYDGGIFLWNRLICHTRWAC